MSNPWLKKNPFMSMWLSAANRMTAAMSAQASALATRQINAAVAQATRENLKLMKLVIESAAPAPPKRRAKRRR